MNANASDQRLDYQSFKGALRCRPIEWLRTRYDELVREERRIHLERLAVLDVLDERGRAEQPDPGVSQRTARSDLETARRLDRLPEVAAAAHAGALSSEQLAPVAQLADETSDVEWARRAPNVAPADLARIERQQRDVSTDDAAARRDARELRWWWREHAGMLSIRGELPDVDGALVKSVIEEMVERQRPAKGEPWDTPAHRGADALVELCRNYAEAEPSGKPKTRIVVHIPNDGTPQVDGISVARSTVEALLGDATVEQALVEDGVPLVYGPGRVAIPPRLAQAVRLRDLYCRWPRGREVRLRRGGGVGARRWGRPGGGQPPPARRTHPRPPRPSPRPRPRPRRARPVSATSSAAYSRRSPFMARCASRLASRSAMAWRLS